MLGVTLICVGKMRERHYIAALEEYRKRLGVFCRLEMIELQESKLPDSPSEKEKSAALEKEGAEILRRLPRGAYTIAMCVEGEKRSSEELAALISELSAGGVSRLCIIVGGSLGLAPSVKKAADMRLSMSDMTFPHHLFRVMLAEQLYRAFTIIKGTQYHK